MVEKIVVGYLSTNAYLYSIWKKECLIVDPGGDASHIINQMIMKNMKPRGIILTHGHLDHIIAAGEIQDFYREKEIVVPIAIHKNDRKYLGPASVKHHSEALKMLDPDTSAHIETVLLNSPEADIFLEEGIKIFGSDLSVLYTPGHTIGSVCLFSEATNTLFSGDTLFFEGIGRTDLDTGNHEELISSIKDKLFSLPVTTSVFPGHGPITSIEREKLHNPFIN